MKNNLVATNSELLVYAPSVINDGIEKDDRVMLKASQKPWRRIGYRTPEGKYYEFLSNEFSLAPGMIAFFYLRRWDEEKCFDTWKNDFASQKAWSKSLVGIRMQTLFAIITLLLLMMFVHFHQDILKVENEKCLRKQGEPMSLVNASVVRSQPIRVLSRRIRWSQTHLPTTAWLLNRPEF